jgi:outer membrane protein TolC
MTKESMKRTLEVLALVLGVLAPPLGAQIPTVTLEEAVRRAQQSQPSVVQARGSVRNAEAQVRSAKGAYLPSLSANTSGATSFSAGPSRTDPNTQEIISGDRTSKSVSMGLSASIDLFTGFRRGADSRSAKATRTAAEASLTDQEFQAGLTATQQFFDALAAEELVAVRQASSWRTAVAISREARGSGDSPDSPAAGHLGTA